MSRHGLESFEGGRGLKPKGLDIGPDKGVYLLLLEARSPMAIGRLGVLPFNGWYVYVGSAQGPGGLRRVARHFGYDQRQGPLRWHVDSLLGCGALRGAVTAVTEEPVECTLAGALGRRLTPAFRGFGSSDCSCRTHLFQTSSCDIALAAAEEAMHELGLAPIVVD